MGIYLRRDARFGDTWLHTVQCLGWSSCLNNRQRGQAKGLPDAKPGPAILQPVVMLDASHEIAIYIHRFHNLDLFQQGYGRNFCVLCLFWVLHTILLTFVVGLDGINLRLPWDGTMVHILRPRCLRESCNMKVTSWFKNIILLTYETIEM